MAFEVSCLRMFAHVNTTASLSKPGYALILVFELNDTAPSTLYSISQVADITDRNAVTEPMQNCLNSNTANQVSRSSCNCHILIINQKNTSASKDTGVNVEQIRI